MLKSIKNLSIGVKIGTGFGIVIAIMSAMGMFSVIKMGEIQSDAEKLAHEYLPELVVSDKLERNMFTAQYLMRGYDVTGSKNYADNAKKYLEETGGNISEAELIAAKFQSLVKLRENIGQMREKHKAYIGIFDKVIEKQSAIINAGKPFDEAAVLYMQNAHDLMDSQLISLKKEINSGANAAVMSDRVKKIQMLHELISTGDAVRISNFKFQAFRSPETAQEGMKNFDKIFKLIDELRPLVKTKENINDVDEMLSGAHEYKKRMEMVLQSWTELQSTMELRIRTGKSFREMAKEISDTGMDRVLKVADSATATLSAVSRNMLVSIIIAFIIALSVAFFITYTIKGSVLKIADFTKKFGNGDLSCGVDISAKDEIGQMADSLNASVKNLKDMMQELADTTHSLSNASEELSAVSSEMAATAEEMSSQAITVAGASEQIAANTGVVAAATEESGAALASIASMTEEMSSTFTHVAESGRKTVENVKDIAQSGENISVQISSIASSVEEMTSSLNEVARHTVQANLMSQNANRRTEDINARMTALSASSKKIGKIVQMIKDIADQTNMLALNATIEAAGAGDAGRGFAVVAGEIKELAKQSAGATDDIAAQIEEIQKSVSDAVSAVGEIGKVVNQTAGINQMIASSAEEQTAAASEISKSVANTAVSAKSVAQKASESSKIVEDIAQAMEESSNTAKEVAHSIEELFRSVQDVARSVDEAAKGVNEISKNIQAISTASKSTAIGASQTSESSRELAKMAASLAEMVNRFKL